MTREIANNGQLLSLTEISVDTRDYKPMESYDHLRETSVYTRDREQWKEIITYGDLCRHERSRTMESYDHLRRCL